METRLFFVILLVVKPSWAVFIISCQSNADCVSNGPRGSTRCDFASDRLFERETCPIGECICLNGFVATPDGCVPVISLNIGDACTGAVRERYPYAAQCSIDNSLNGVVTCPENTRFEPTAMPPGCKYILPVRSFGEACDEEKSWCDKTHGLICSKLSQKCSCENVNALWRDGECTLNRVYGDSCRRNSDCSPVNGPTAVGLVCRSGRCVCQDGFVARVFSMRGPPINPNDGSTVRYRLMCLNDSISAPKETGEICNVLPDGAAAAVGASVSSPIGYCWHHSICHRCPGDPASKNSLIKGRCYKLSRRPPIPKPMLDIFWLYFTTPRTITRPPEPSTLPMSSPVTPSPPNGRGDWSGKFGDNCWTDADCHQTAFCLLDLVNSIHPPCSAAICVCRHGNEPATDGICRPVRHLLVGDRCTNPIFEILPSGTACINGIVTCDSPMFEQDPNFDTQCMLAVTILTYGQVCLVGDTQNECDSAAGLDCLAPASADPTRRGEGNYTETRCWCTVGMWDGAACQVSDFGEVCRVNSDCRGYPLAGIMCKRGVCVCQNGYRPFRTLQLILMQRESLGPGGALANSLGAATLYRQTVCVNENTTYVASLNGECSALIDPRGGSRLCRNGLFCFRCPSSSDSSARQTAATLSKGSCRTLNMLSSSGLDLLGGGSEVPYRFRASDTIEAGTIGKSCFENSDCSLYQACAKPTLSQPQFVNQTYECKRGLCMCQPGYGLDVNQLCRPYVSLKVGQWCSLTSTNTMYPANAGCYFSRVECNYPYVAKNGTCHLSPMTRIRENDETCADVVDVCRMPLVCLENKKCGCPDEADVYDYSLAVCRHRLYGEECTNDTECDNGGYASIGKGACNVDLFSSTGGSCGCAPREAYEARVTRWNSTSSSKYEATICLDNIVSRNTRQLSMSMCSLRLVQQQSAAAISIIDQGGLCERGLLCHQCPDDREKISQSYGFCRPLE